MSTTTSTAPAEVAGTQGSSRQERRRVILASTIGTTIEFYDFYAYATAAVAVFPFLFFPKSEDPTVDLLKSFATFGLAFIARPLGSVIFGHFGDRVGRKATLVGSLLTMGIATFIIGCLPTYEQIGLAAPAALALMRFCQGLGLGGEWSGAALLATETAEHGKRARAAMWPQLGAPFGFILANGLFLILVLTFGHSTSDPTAAFLGWAWRIPFLFSIVMVAIGLWVRFKLDETPVFKDAIDKGKKLDTPVLEVFRVAPKPLIAGTFIMVGCYTLFYLVTTWILSFGIGSKEAGMLGMAYNDFLVLQLISIFGFVFGIPISGHLADTVGRRKTLTWVTVAIIIYSLTFSFFLSPERASEVSVLIFLTIGMFLMGLIFGPMSAVLPELFPTNVRYTGSGISYNVSSILGAAIAPFIATALAAKYGVTSVGIYLLIVSVISLVAIITMRESRHHDLTAI